MKNIKIYIVAFISFLAFNLAGIHAEALSKQTIIDWDESYYDGGTEEFSFHVSEIGTLFVNLEDTIADDDYSICIKDNYGVPVYGKQIDWLEDENSSFDVELSEGDYTIVFSTDGMVEFSVQAYFEYKPSINHPVFEISEEVLELYVGESAVLTIESQPEGVLFDTEWSSSDSSVAAVSENGIVTAKKAGSAVIKAVIHDEAYACKVYVSKRMPAYKEMVASAKKYQTKRIKFKQIDVGYQSRLYDYGSWGSRFYKSRGYGLIIEDESYIEIKKKGNTATISLIIAGTHQIVAANPMYRGYTKLKLYTSNRKITYDFTSHSENARYRYKYHAYITTLKWKSKISSNSDVSLEKLNKLIRIFEHKNVTLKTLTDEGSEKTWGKLPESTRKSWLKLFRTYKKLLALYE